MPLQKKIYPFAGCFVLLIFLFSCHNPKPLKQKQIVAEPEKIDIRVAENIEASLDYANDNNGKVDDSSFRFFLIKPVNKFYKNRDYLPVWCSMEKWKPLADSLYQFIGNAELSGLFPNDYRFKDLSTLKTMLDKDSVKRMDAALWMKADLIFTDGFMHIIKDLKQGRLFPDSISSNKDSSLPDHFFISNLKELLSKKNFTTLLNSLEPKQPGYWQLKNCIKSFVDTMNRKVYTHVIYPYKKGNAKDSLLFITTFKKRLNESGVVAISDSLPDSVQIKLAIKKLQQQKGITADGKITASLIRSLNNNDAERFKRIAVTLDRYKQMPEKMPEKYILVNLPGYYLRVIDDDTIALESKIICGKPDTRTPLLTSKIINMETYPTWTVPTSIIVKTYLPKLKKNPNYINKMGLKLFNSKGEPVDSKDVDWKKYSKGIPYKLMQESGDKNSLGVFKFNFNNPYAVYLHDTNQRYLFKNADRDYSHGCVRVHEWQKLAFYIARNDSINATVKNSIHYNSDSISKWLSHKISHRIMVKNQLPLFIRYFSCEGKNGKIIFYDDIYGEDKMLMEKYFADK